MNAQLTEWELIGYDIKSAYVNLVDFMTRDDINELNLRKYYRAPEFNMSGKVYGHKRHRDGSHLVTTSVTVIKKYNWDDPNERAFLIKTRNSIYICRLKDCLKSTRKTILAFKKDYSAEKLARQSCIDEPRRRWNIFS